MQKTSVSEAFCIKFDVDLFFNIVSVCGLVR